MALRPPRSPASLYGQVFEGALEAGLSVVIGVVAGYYADRLFGTHPFLLVGLTLAGLAASVRRLLKLAELGQPPPDPPDGEPLDGAAGPPGPPSGDSARAVDRAGAADEAPGDAGRSRSEVETASRPGARGRGIDD